MSSFYDILEEISSGASVVPTHNEDVIGYKGTSQSLDLWVIDGATSIADGEYLGLPVSDPQWFAETMSDYFYKGSDSGATPPSIVSASVKEVASAYDRMTKNQEIPLSYKPLAAMLWLRATPQGDQTTLELWSLGDCRVLIGQPGAPTPLLFPQLARGDISPHGAPSPVKSTQPEERSRTGVLLSHALLEKDIREAKHTNPKTARLGFHPDSILYATTHTTTVSALCSILAMSDGFYRLVDEYGLYNDEGLLQACCTRGLPPLLQELREYEGTRDLSQAVKKSDDASAILVHLPAISAKV